MSYKLPEGKIVILLGAHLSNILLRMVVITDQVQDTMDNDPVQLILELGPVKLRVLPDRIHADEEITVQAVTLAVVERDDVREVIVLQILHIHVQDVVVRAENDGNITQPPDLTLGDQFEPTAGKPLLLESELRIFVIIGYHNQNFVQIYK